MADIKKIVEDSFTRYAGNVILNRAICDARDMLKPSARMLMYSQMVVTKNIPSKPFVKSARVVGDALGHYYEHGDSSCYGTYMRMSKPFAMRYPLEDCQGNNGTLNSTNDEASMRYTELRLSPLGYGLFNDIDKDTIYEWSENFDETEKYPKVAPSKGYYNICNGTVGLGIAVSSAIPQFNLREVNEALIKLLWNPNIAFEEICVMPDYATGAILLNGEEVEKSLETGTGAAARLRSIIEYDKNKRALIVRELPYGVYTQTISEQIQKLLEKNPNCGIDNVNDASHKKPDYEIYLTKSASPDKVLKLLYKETSLESFSGINMTVLVDGKKPAVLGLKELFQLHLDHEKKVYQRGFQYDLKKIESRLHIIDALLICLASIDDVVQTIKTSSSGAAANEALQKKFLLDEIQAKAILDMKLSRLARLEVKKIENEKEGLEKEKARIESILNDENLLKKEIEKGLREVADKFGDARRTKVMDIATEDEEPTEIRQLLINLTNKNNVFISETSTLYTTRRNTVGAKFKLDKGEYVIHTATVKTTDTLLFFSKEGNYFYCFGSSLPIGEKVAIESIISCDGESICGVTAYNKNNAKKYIVFSTKKGYLKKSLLSDYNTKRKGGVKALALESGDEICSISFVDEEKLAMLTAQGQFLIVDTKDIRAIGRTSRGIKGIKLNESDLLLRAAPLVGGVTEIVTCTEGGMIKRTDISEFSVQGTNTKGRKIQRLKENDFMVDFLPLRDEKEFVLVSKTSRLKLSISDIPLLGAGAQGVHSAKLSATSKIVGLNFD